MFAFIYSLVLFAAEGGKSSAFTQFYNDYLNIPGFELWKFINLAIFTAIMIYLLKRPLSQAFKEKREAIRAELIKAEQEKQAALEKLAAAEAKLTALENEKQSVVERAREEAEAEKNRLAEQTNIDIQKLREQTDSEISRIGQIARNELRRFSAEESVKRAEEKLRSRIDAASDARLVKASINEIGGLN
jgi:F0F1-type ATP synthase membrane subunit b/b'